MACDFSHERFLHQRGYQCVAGVDEAGRGPLAGPVVAAAVILPDDFEHTALNDSKQLSPARREVLFEEMTTQSDVVWAVAMSSVEEIDRFNILQATHLAMRKALSKLSSAPDHVLVDGLEVPKLGFQQTALVRGDGQSFSIAAASVLAKVTRDRLMREWDVQFPYYGFARHKGYGTPEHLAMLTKYGPCPIHRRSFAPVAQMQFSF